MNRTQVTKEGPFNWRLVPTLLLAAVALRRLYNGSSAGFLLGSQVLQGCNSGRFTIGDVITTPEIWVSVLIVARELFVGLCFALASWCCYLPRFGIAILFFVSGIILHVLLTDCAKSIT